MFRNNGTQADLDVPLRSGSQEDVTDLFINQYRQSNVCGHCLHLTCLPVSSRAGPSDLSVIEVLVPAIPVVGSGRVSSTFRCHSCSCSSSVHRDYCVKVDDCPPSAQETGFTR
ncbi:hypothetical protein J6590_031370 [Homalodisca vitripennis]|nr:hypothetical protein J6590_031370 [Homalodisca vitripennis]